MRNDAGDAAGNLAAMRMKANHAKVRIDKLCSFGKPMQHGEPCALLLHVLPPNRLRFFHPLQALQAFVSQQLPIGKWVGGLTG